MKVLCTDRIASGVSPEDLGPHLRDEAREVWKLYGDGVVREMYFRVPAERGGAVLMLECPSVEEAKEVVDALPLTKAGLIEWDVAGLGPFTPVLNALFEGGSPGA